MIALLTAMFMLATPDQPGGADVGRGPEPSRVPQSWEIELKYMPPKRLVMPGGDTYWYMVYTAINTSSTTQRFFPTFQLVTEDLRVIDTDTGIGSAAFDAIKQIHKVTHPRLQSMAAAIGPLAVGDDNARESVAIWRASDVDVNNFTIYVAGLSGETKMLRNPAYDSKKPEKSRVRGADGVERELAMNPKHFTLRKTLELQCALPGSQVARAIVEPELVRARWVMR